MRGIKFIRRKLSTTKEVVFTGIQPTGHLHIGNYIGSLRNLMTLQQRSQTLLLSIVDHHAITTRFHNDHSDVSYKANLREETKELAQVILACGINPNKTIFFIQSHVPQHTEMAWLLSCSAPKNWLNPMVQYKEKGGKQGSLGLYSYPVLMAADILLYRAKKVPVGDDQRQHLELAQKYVDRINGIFGDNLLTRPQYVQAPIPRVMSLTDGTRKMSKSEKVDRSRINLTDSQDIVRSKIAKAKTDSINSIYLDQKNRPEVSNLLRLYAALSRQSMSEVQNLFKNKSIMEFKKELSGITVKQMSSIQTNLLNLRKDPTQVDRVLKEGAAKAQKIAKQTLFDVKKAMGYYQ